MDALLTYNTADQLIGVTYATGGAVERMVNYFYDAAGSRTGMVERIGNATNVTAYTANSDNQLTSATANRQGITVTGYVEPGPRSNKWYASTATARGQSAAVSQQNGTFAIPGVPVTGGANALTVTVTDVSGNVATQVVNVTVVNGSAAIGYDANGNQTKHNDWAMAYDRENRLASASSAALAVSYSYDALGRLIQRVAGNSTNRLYYAGWQLIAEYDGTGTLQRKYVYGPGIDEPIRMITGGTNYYYHADGLGSTTEITDSTGNLVEQYRYDVYGAPTFLNTSGAVTNASAINNRLLFTGHDRDTDTELYNVRLRYYSPRLGRFMQPDPMRILGDGVNLYTYALNNPTTFVDPDGASAQEASQYWTDVAANGYGNGLWGGVKSFWGNSMNMFLNMWNAVEIEQQAEKSGYYSAIPGCAGKAWGHGLAAGGLLALDYVQFTGLAKAGQMLKSGEGLGWRGDSPHHGLGPHDHFGPYSTGPSVPGWGSKGARWQGWYDWAKKGGGWEWRGN